MRGRLDARRTLKSLVADLRIHHKFLQIGCSQRQSFWLILCIQIVYIIANFLLAPIVNINVLLFVDILSALALIFFLDSKKSREKSQRFAERKKVTKTVR